MVYRYDRRLKKRSPKWVLRGATTLLFFMLMGSTAFSLSNDSVNAPTKDKMRVASKLLIRGSQPRRAHKDKPNKHKKDKQKNSEQKNQEKAGATANLATTSSTLASSTEQGCSVTGPSSNFSSSISPEIKKLSEFETVCNGSFIEGTMLFTSMPITSSEATSMATDTAYRLKEYSKFSLHPVIIMEPLTSQGYLDFEAFAAGTYDTVMDTYFSTLRSAGISDAMLGTLVPFPEANIPVWGNVDPADVSNGITKLTNLQKKQFPASKTSVLLDSKSYPNDNSWENGSYASLLPYVQSVPKGLIDSFGLQGYPWPDTVPEHRASVFVSASQAIEVAQALGVSDIWFNTGTFRKGTAWNGTVYSLTPEQRHGILMDIIEQAKIAKNQGFQSSIMLFAENKFNLAEGNDWSYWDSGTPLVGPHTSVFVDFQRAVTASGIPLSIFDSY